MPYSKSPQPAGRVDLLGFPPLKRGPAFYGVKVFLGASRITALRRVKPPLMQSSAGLIKMRTRIQLARTQPQKLLSFPIAEKYAEVGF
jgi:hypothetical protein